MLSPNSASPLAGQVALVTGAGRGIGAEVSAVLAEAGAAVVVSGRGSNIESTAARIRAEHPDAVLMTCPLDVMSGVEWTDAICRIRERYGRLDILVNNAGGFIPRNDLVQVDDADWDYAYRVNVDSVFYGCRAVVPVMMEQRSGTIVNIGSFFGEFPQPQFAAYCSSKAAVKALSQSLAVELAPHSITVNAISPGYIESEMYREALQSLAEHNDSSLEEAEQLVLSTIPVGRVGTGREIGATVVFLAGPGGRYFTAQSLVQGGGVLYR